jgi:hypothetical protein
MKAFKRTFSLIDCGRVSRKTKGLFSGPFSEPGTYPFVWWG